MFILIAVFEVDAWAVKSMNQALASQNRQTNKTQAFARQLWRRGQASGSKLEQFTVPGSFCSGVRRLEQLGTDLLIGVLRTGSHRVENSGPQTGFIKSFACVLCTLGSKTLPSVPLDIEVIVACLPKIGMRLCFWCMPLNLFCCHQG